MFDLRIYVFMFCLLSFAFITTRLQCNPDAASRLADEHALIATFVNRLQSGARSVLGRCCWSGGVQYRCFLWESRSSQRCLASASKQREIHSVFSETFWNHTSTCAHRHKHAEGMTAAGKWSLCPVPPCCIRCAESPVHKLGNITPGG